VANQVIVESQPSEAELAQQQADGLKTVINFRHGGEDEQPFGAVSRQ
jgi:protein tyrosine phosphatase (PTP) superfamily phosphohydrolase (DUF442 family)